MCRSEEDALAFLLREESTKCNDKRACKLAKPTQKNSFKEQGRLAKVPDLHRFFMGSFFLTASTSLSAMHPTRSAAMLQINPQFFVPLFASHFPLLPSYLIYVITTILILLPLLCPAKEAHVAASRSCRPQHEVIGLGLTTGQRGRRGDIHGQK